MTSNKLEHIPNIAKHLIDAGIGTSVVVTWITTITPFLNLLIALLAITWGFYRIHDIRLSVKIKQKILDGENPDENN